MEVPVYGFASLNSTRSEHGFKELLLYGAGMTFRCQDPVLMKREETR
jgi:hypothetical protein